MHYTYWIVVVFVRVCLCVCVCVCVCGHMLDTYKVFSPPYCSSFKFEFALENLLGIP